MTKRKSPTPNMYREICMRQMAKGYVVHVGNGSYRLGCPICEKAIDPLSKMVREHWQALERGGEDDPSNMFFVHAHCAKAKTFGTGATTSGSDIGEIAKTKRLEKAREAMERGDKPKPKAKIQSRGFGNTKFKKKLDGTVVER